MAGGEHDAQQLRAAGVRRGQARKIAASFARVDRQLEELRAILVKIAPEVVAVYAEKYHAKAGVELCGRINGGFICEMLAGSRCPDCSACHDVGEGS